MPEIGTTDISVIMSVYNGEKYLKRSILSILNQSFTNFEFIIIDDGSSDSSSSIINDFSDDRIRYIKNEKNLGLSASLNIGIKNSIGAYIARADSDDVSLPERLEKQFNFMEENPQIGILGTGYYEIDGNGKRLQKFIYPQDDIIIKWKLLTGPVFPHPTVILRKNILTNNNIIYNEKYSATQDYELWYQLIQFTVGSNLPIPLIEYRKHKNSISNTMFNKQNELRLQVSGRFLSLYSGGQNFDLNLISIFQKITEDDINSLSNFELIQGYKFVLEIITEFRKRNELAKSSYKKWQIYQILPLMNQLEKNVLNNFSNGSDVYPIFIEYIFKLVFQNKMLWISRIITNPRLILYYHLWAILYLTHLIRNFVKGN